MTFRFRLALALGKTYHELSTGEHGLGDCEGIDETYWWMAFDRIMPFGYLELRLGQLCTMTHNSNVVEDRHRVTLQDYWYARKPEQTKQEKENVVRCMFGFPPE